MDLGEFCNRRSLNEKNFAACCRSVDGKLRVAVMTRCTPSLGEVWQRCPARALELLETLKCVVMRFLCLIWAGTVSVVTHDIITHTHAGVGQRRPGKSTVTLFQWFGENVLSDCDHAFTSSPPLELCVCWWVSCRNIGAVYLEPVGPPIPAIHTIPQAGEATPFALLLPDVASELLG